MRAVEKFLFITFFVVFMSICSISQAHVLDGAIECNGHYYKVFQMQMSWNEAKRFCENVGGHLATAETSTENEAIKRIVNRQTNNRKGVSYWMGAYSEPNGIWRWVTGKILSDYYDWWKGEYPGSEQFMKISFSSEGAWWHSSKSENLSFICEWESASAAHEATI